jgi:hypothetical protein
MIDRNYFIDIFADIVNEVRKIYDPSGLEKPYFMYGHPIDITKQLQLKDLDEDQKIKRYPLVCLLLDLQEKHGINSNYEYSVSPTVLILAETDPNYTSEQRTVSTFKPILYPIFIELIEAVRDSIHLIISNREVEFIKTDKYFWGKEGIKMRGYDGMIFNDYLDGIQLDFKDLNIYKHSIC